jgi:mannose-1-phosphate guanylyltransferase
MIMGVLPDLPHRNIILEPVGKNTAPCIALSAFHINKIYKDATIAVLPSDHLIKDEDNFLKVLNSADKCG